MQLHALGSDEEVIYAGYAEKHRNYICLECAQTVRLRSGFHRQPHFYHLLPNHKCRLNAKSMPHLMLQHHLESILPPGEVQLECRFPAINRIADVAWITKKLIFEVQCSPISAAEVMQRNDDYASQGYQVIWLLHEARYNQQRVTAAEDVLKHWPHYFSDMNSEGEGEIFDQLSFIVNGMRKQRMPKLTVDVSQPCRELILDEAEMVPYYFPKIIRDRLLVWPLCFQGDYGYICHRKFCDKNLLKEFLGDIREVEDKWLKNNGVEFLELSIWECVKALYMRWIAFPYRSILRLLLERASR